MPAGPGWALVGDAGYHKDPITAQGMLDAFRDAELLADAVDRGLERRPRRRAGRLPAGPRRGRPADVRVHRAAWPTSRRRPPPEMLGLLAALDGNPAQISRFLGLIAGSVPIPEFFSPDEPRPDHGRRRQPRRLTR